MQAEGSGETNNIEIETGTTWYKTFDMLWLSLFDPYSFIVSLKLLALTQMCEWNIQTSVEA